MDFHSISQPISFSAEQRYCDPSGTHDTEIPHNQWQCHFLEQPDGSTLVDIVISFRESADLRTWLDMGFEDGLTRFFEKLDRRLLQKPDQDAEAEIRNLIEEWCQAIRDIDREGIQSDHTTDIRMFDVAPPLQNDGLEEYRKTWDLYFQYSPGGAGSFELQDLRITAGTDVAYCTALIVLGKGRDPECRLTIGLKKLEGQWRIAHEHHSAPVPIS